jgi:hypothetical protein
MYKLHEYVISCVICIVHPKLYNGVFVLIFFLLFQAWNNFLGMKKINIAVTSSNEIINIIYNIKNFFCKRKNRICKNILVPISNKVKSCNIYCQMYGSVIVYIT